MTSIRRSDHEFWERSNAPGAIGEETKAPPELRGEGLSHVDSAGNFRMVDVTEKPASVRFAHATGTIRMKPETLKAIHHNTLAKGDVIPVARLAGIQAAKRTAELIPLCHDLPLSFVDVRIEVLDDRVAIEAEARTSGQ